MQARGPNALNMNAYVNGEEEEADFLEEGTSSRPNIDIRAIEEQFDTFVKDMQKYDKILSDVAKNIDDIDGDGDFITDFYPKFISDSTYDEDQEKRVVQNNDPQLAKIIFSLEKNNKVLKEDMRSWVLEFAKTAKLTEVLIEENKVLRLSIAKKNKEIVKLIQGIGKAENEEITELQENLQVLKEENGVLREHLSKLKEEIVEKKKEEERVTTLLQKAQEECSKVEKQKGEAEDEQQHLSKTFELIQQWRSQTDRRKRKLEKQKQQLLARKNELQGQKQKIERQLRFCSKDKSDLESGLKKNYHEQQAQKYRLMEEISELGDKISKEKQECRYFEQQIVRNTNKKVEYQKIAKEYLKKISDNEEQVKLLRKQLDALKQSETNVQCQIELQRYDIENLSRELKELEQREKGQELKWKKTLKKREEQKSQQISQHQAKIVENQRESAMKIIKQKNQLSTKQKQLTKWQQKVYKNKEELTDLKAELKEIKQNQIKLAQLKSKLQYQDN